jgi:hypothetical protein
VRLILERLPLPGVLGGACPHPLEDQCRRREVDEPAAICALKRFAADQVDLGAISPPPVEARSNKIAVSGDGKVAIDVASPAISPSANLLEFRPKSWSGRPDLNRGPPAPKAGALTRLRHVPITGCQH